MKLQMTPEMELALQIAGLSLLAAAVLVAMRRYKFGEWGQFKRKPKGPPPLLRLTPKDDLTMEQAYCGILAMGGTGSGKTSTFAHLLLAFMLRGCGLLILTSKHDDYEMVFKLAEEAGRTEDLVRFCPANSFRFDFLQHELASGGSKESTTQFLQDLMDVATRMKSGNANDVFWPQAAARQLRMALTSIYLATGTASNRDLYKFITSLPHSAEQVKDNAWKKDAYCVQMLMQALAKHPDNEDLEMAADYCLVEYPNLGEKTAAGITATSMNVLEKFMSGDVGKLVSSGQTNFSPDNIIRDGCIAVIDTPALRDREPGQLVQTVWKLSTIRAVLRRNLAVYPRPVVIWADEAQLHAIPSVDSMTQAVARSHRLINVALTQNINLLHSVFHSKEDTFAWCSNMTTRFIFANPDRDTNEYHSALCGQSKQLLMGGSTQTGKRFDWIGDQLGEEQGGNASFNESWQNVVRPEEFLRFRKGGRENNCLVDCLVIQGGRVFSNGKTWLKATFKQM